MKIGVLKKLDQEPKDINARDLISTARIDSARNGLVLKNPKVTVGRDNDDFLQDLLTVVVLFNAYRAPRIITKKIK